MKKILTFSNQLFTFQKGGFSNLLLILANGHYWRSCFKIAIYKYYVPNIINLKSKIVTLVSKEHRAMEFFDLQYIV